MNRTDGSVEDAMAPVGDSTGDDSTRELSFAEMMAETGGDGGEAESPAAESEDLPDPEPEPKASALSEDDEALLKFGRDIADGFDVDPAGTIDRLIKAAAQRDPEIAAKIAATVSPKAEPARAGAGLPEDFEPLDELGVMLAPHAEALTRMPGEMKSMSEAVERLGPFTDQIAVQVRAQSAITNAVLSAMGLAPLPAIDVTPVIDDVLKRGKSYDVAFEERVGKLLRTWSEAAAQKAAPRPETPRGSTRAPVAGNGSFADLWASTESDVDSVRSRAIVKDGAMRPLGGRR